MYYYNGQLYFNFRIKLNPSNCIMHILGRIFALQVEQVQRRIGGQNYILCSPLVDSDNGPSVSARYRFLSEL